MQWTTKLNLPDTQFAMKANLAVREVKWLEEWYTDNIYQQIRASRIGKKNIFCMMALHMRTVQFLGHAVNKVLKDVIVKAVHFQVLMHRMFRVGTVMAYQSN